MKGWIFFLVSILMFSCDFGNNNENTNPNVEEQPIEKVDNWLVIPGKQVGRIQANFNGSDIYKTFGEGNVATAEIGLGEGETKQGLLVFPNTKNELQVIFEGEEKMDKIESIKIQKEGSMWKTEEGVQVGTTLEELVKLNGKDFQFYGFEWDYAGRLASWEGGKLNENLVVYLDPTNMEAAMKMLGDQSFSTADKSAKVAGLKVISYEINFN